MGNYIVMTFATTPELKACLEQWAAEDDRSISYIMRQILTQEAQRRKQPPRQLDVSRQSSQ